jgi:23S rRNA (adenine2503-C2)-methyltransferase
VRVQRQRVVPLRSRPVPRAAGSGPSVSGAARRRQLPPLPPPPTWPGPTGPDGRPLVDVKGLLPHELEALLRSWGQPAYRGRQLFQWLHGKGARSFAEIRVLPAALRARLEAEATLLPAELVARQVDPGDGTVKYLLRLGDGLTVEAVLMRYRFGYTACVSSQVGCRMGCRFCASTLGGLRRNLRAGEMAEQVALLGRDLAQHGGDPARFPVPPDEGPTGQGPRWSRVSRVVVMGMGEPLENLDEVVRFLRLIHEPDGAGIGWRHMTVSTSGLVPGIDRLAEEGLPITLAVSLHAPNDTLRDRLVPLNRRYPLAELLAACRRYVERTGRRLTFEYVMISGVNDLPEHARELGRLLRGLPCHVNLIPLNPVPEWNLTPSTPEAMARFRALVRGAGLPCTIRRQLGTAIDAACGQLRRRAAAETAPRA